MRLTLFAAVLVLGAATLAGCQPKTDVAGKAPDAKADASPGAPSDASPGAPSGAIGQDAPNAPTPVQVAVRATSFDPLSKTAESVTGALSLTALPQAGPNAAPTTRMQTSNGTVYETELIPGGAEQATAVDWSKLFGTKVSFEPNAPVDVPSVDLHSINRETISAKAPHGGFCGKEKTGFLAMAIPISTPTGVIMAIAAFKGDRWPPKDGSGLCGVYTYNMPH